MRDNKGLEVAIQVALNVMDWTFSDGPEIGFGIYDYVVMKNIQLQLRGYL